MVNASKEEELETAFDSLAKLRPDALVAYGDPFFDGRREKIVGLSGRHAILATYPWREYVLSGGG